MVLVKKGLHIDVVFVGNNVFPEDWLNVVLYRRQGQPAATGPSLVVPTQGLYHRYTSISMGCTQREGGMYHLMEGWVGLHPQELRHPKNVNYLEEPPPPPKKNKVERNHPFAPVVFK